MQQAVNAAASCQCQPGHYSIAPPVKSPHKYTFSSPYSAGQQNVAVCVTSLWLLTTPCKEQGTCWVKVARQAGQQLGSEASFTSDNIASPIHRGGDLPAARPSLVGTKKSDRVLMEPLANSGLTSLLTTWSTVEMRHCPSTRNLYCKRHAKKFSEVQGVATSQLRAD